ncbi:helix-turn-helix domain-containing protein [Methylosinus sp. KRF6]|uniref:AbiU2 domain-containing protein n=1 Tax=Methylosinus sp. KRF6 TaxID=2846853 RepID=UPI00209ACC61|nr:helix-turn-helix domain-containing protein [Methylosinus sp. KRF6]
MQPEQMRAARAALNWSLERLAEASGVHRNTISNFETRKYDGEPEKLAAVKRALESAGVIFIKENGEAAGVRLRRFQVGDRVRFRPQTRVRFSYDIEADEIGTVVGVEPHPLQTGPTYRMEVEFPRAKVPYVFRFEYELVQAAPDTAQPAQPLQAGNKKTMSGHKAIIEEFCIICEQVWTDYDLFQSVFGKDRRAFDLYRSISPLLFEGLNRIMHENCYMQFCKITDNANTGKHSNLTTNYIIEQIPWPAEVAKNLKEVNERLMAFRQHIEPARSKRIAHVDLSAQVERWDNLGAFPKGAEMQFLQDLQKFVNIAYGHFHGGSSRPIEVSMSTDTHQLLRALVKSVIFDRCSKCTEHERIVAVLDYELPPVA